MQSDTNSPVGSHATSPNAGGASAANTIANAPALGSNIGTHNPAHNKADLDVGYLKEKRIPALLETLAAEFIVHKPHDPESYLKNRFFVGSEGAIDAGSAEAGIVYVSKLCPLSAIVKMAVTRCAARMQVKELDASPSAGGSSGSSSSPTSVGGSKFGGPSGAAGPTAVTSFAPTNRADVACSPFGKTPCLEHNGLALLEVGPVVRYLCHGTPYLPPTLRPRMKVEVAFDVIVANVLPHATIAVNEKFIVPRLTNRPVDNAAIQQAASRFRSDLVQLTSAVGANTSQFFSESVWVAGREPSIADMALAAGLFAVQSVGGFDVITGLSRVEKWWDAARTEQWYVKGLADWHQLAASLHTR